MPVRADRAAARTSSLTRLDVAPLLEALTITCDPVGATAIALASRLSRICSTAPTGAPEMTRSHRPQRHALLRSDVAPSIDAFTRHFGDVDRMQPRMVHIAAREHEQSIDDAAEAGDLLDRRIDLRCFARREMRLEVLEAEPQGSQRRPQLMRGVRHEALLRVDELFEPAGSAVERRRERAELGRAMSRRRSGREIAGGHLFGRFLELLHRTGDTSSKEEPDGCDRGEDERARADPSAPGIAHAASRAAVG
jgi:hypothetical protein